jgi:ABC-2 type transport system permease protein
MTFGTTMDSHLNKLQFIQNAVDWSVEDLDLLTIRARGAHVRLLLPLDQAEETFWEGLNYALALAALIALGVVWHLRRNAEQPMILDEAVLDMSQKRIEA